MTRRQTALLRQTTDPRRDPQRNASPKPKAITMPASNVPESNKASVSRLMLLPLLASLLIMISWSYARATEIQRVISDKASKPGSWKTTLFRL